MTNIPAGYKRSHVWKKDSTYYLVAAGSNDTTLHVFTGTDKINFTDQGQIIGTSPEVMVTNSFLWNEGNNWYILYEGKESSLWNIYLATASSYTGPWTKQGLVIRGGGIYAGIGNPELARNSNGILKINNNYYMYAHGQTDEYNGYVGRFHSSDLFTWFCDGYVDGIRPVHSLSWTYGDQALCEFNGKTYLFWSPSDQVSTSHIDCGIDSRDFATVLYIPPYQ